MNLLRLLSLLMIGIVLTSPAFAGEPTPGVYFTPSLGGTVLEGRATTSWALPGNAAMGLNDVWNSMSWNGAALGTEWKFQCAVATAVNTVQDNRDVNGTGTVVITAMYTGGTFFLSKNGPWGTGVEDYTGVLGVTSIITTLQYVGNTFVTGRENINSSGSFDGSSCALTFLLTNGNRLGDTDCCLLPTNYPGLLDTDCAPTRSFGSWSDIVDVSLQIDCSVPTEETTWGQVKAIYEGR